MDTRNHHSSNRLHSNHSNHTPTASHRLRNGNRSLNTSLTRFVQTAGHMGSRRELTHAHLHQHSNTSAPSPPDPPTLMAPVLLSIMMATALSRSPLQRDLCTRHLEARIIQSLRHMRSDNNRT